MQPTEIQIPELALVLLVGVSGAGKSSFARQHFLPTEIISSDTCRGLISDDENNQQVTREAFELLYAIAEKRLQLGRLTVIDATHIQPDSRVRAIQLAKQMHVQTVVIVLNTPLEVCKARNAKRTDRHFGDHVLYRQQSQLRRTLKQLKREFRYVHYLQDDAVNNVRIARKKLWNNKKDARGPFDLIGDVHGCCDELEMLLEKLGYAKGSNGWSHPEQRQAIFLGDLVDRGPRNLDALFLARDMVSAGNALCIMGNHENKFLRYLMGKNVKRNHGLENTAAEIEALPTDVRTKTIAEARTFIESLVAHYVLDNGDLVVAHAGLKEAYQGRASGRVKSFALYGETTGEVDSFGLPVRLDWAAKYRGKATVVYGHVPVPEPEWVNNTLDIDNGCVFGGKLTALRYPEKDIVSVPAKQVYYAPKVPLISVQEERSAQQALDDVLDWSEVSGKQYLHTRLKKTVVVQAAHAAAALEVLNRFAVNPKWLMYLPPTMSPTETSERPGYLEYPTEAFSYYRDQGVRQVVCQQKHMGSRAVVVLCREPEVAVRRFGLESEAQGRIYTRTGRSFFKDLETEHDILKALAEAAESTFLWRDLKTDWMILDVEVLPWSAKAGTLLEQQYAGVSAAAEIALPEIHAAFKQAQSRSFSEETSETVQKLQQQYRDLEKHVNQYTGTYRGYCWPIENKKDLKIAPFHLLATEGVVHFDKTHGWHLEHLARFNQADAERFIATEQRVVDLSKPEQEQAACDWWETLTAAGGEGMVVKPFDYLEHNGKDFIQPALKCRGREYLRMIYGPDYTRPEQFERLKLRNLGRKRSLAMRELALGMDALERFVHREPLRNMHRNIVGILAMESEPVDPRL